MGFFSNLFGGNHQSKQETPKSSQTKSGGEQRARSADPVAIKGDQERTVYVYHGAPLIKVPVGEEIWLEVIPRDVKMKSDLTGTVANSKEGTPLAYNGRPVGFLSYVDTTISTLVRRGHPVTICATRTGTYAPGFPSIVALMPSFSEMRCYVDAKEKAKKEGKIIVYNVGDSGYKGSLLSQGKVSTYVTVTLIPTPEGSSAKPRIALIDDNGNTLDEFGARNSRYKQFEDLVGKRLKATVETKPSEIEGNSFYYHFEVDLR